jgi:hypothetical protein
MTQANIYIHQLRDKSNKLFLLNLYKIAACYPKSVTRISELLFFGKKVMGICMCHNQGDQLSLWEKSL